MNGKELVRQFGIVPVKGYWRQYNTRHQRLHWGRVRAHYRGTPGLALGWGGGKP